MRMMKTGRLVISRLTLLHPLTGRERSTSWDTSVIVAGGGDGAYALSWHGR